MFCHLRVRLSLQFFTHRNVNVSSFARVYLERAKLSLKFNRLFSYRTRWSSFFFLSSPFHAFNYFPYFISTFSLDILEVLLKSVYWQQQLKRTFRILTPLLIAFSSMSSRKLESIKASVHQTGCCIVQTRSNVSAVGLVFHLDVTCYDSVLVSMANHTVCTHQ